MAKPNRPSAERLIEAPIIYADKVPTVSLNSGIVDLTLAATLTEVLEDDTRRQRLIVVADIKMPLATAAEIAVTALFSMRLTRRRGTATGEASRRRRCLTTPATLPAS